MPTVPTVDATAAGAQPYAAPDVAPVRNSAPQQIGQNAAVLDEAGGFASKLGNTVGDHLAAQVDEATVKSAESTALGQVQTILHDPKTGYLFQQGKAAVDQYEPAKAAVAKAFQDQADNLSNGIQKQMFQQVAQAHLLSAGQTMATYNHGQTTAWSAQESKARASTFQLSALNAMDSRYQVDADGNRNGDFAKNVMLGEQEVLNAAHLAGFEPDSAQAQSMVREWHTGLNASVIATLMDSGDATSAKKWLDEQKEVGNIDIRDVKQLETQVKGEYMRQQSMNYVDKTVIPTVLNQGSGTPVTYLMPQPGSSISAVRVTGQIGDSRDGGRVHNGIDIPMPVGTKLQAPASGTVTRVWNDEQFGGGLSVEMKFPDGHVGGYAHLSAVNVKEGDTIQQGGIVALSGKSGNATGPVLHYMMKDADGKYVDPRQVSHPQPNPAGISDPTAVARGIEMIQNNPDLNVEQKRSAVSYLEQQHMHQRSIEDQQNTDLNKQASDAFYGGGMNVANIPPSLFSQLRPEQQQKFRDEQTDKVLRDYNQGQAFKTMNETDIVSDFYANPKMVTPQNVEQARSRLSNSTYLSLMNRAADQQKNPQGVIEAQNVEDRIRHFAAPAGINVDPKTTVAKQTLNDLRYSVSNAIDSIKHQNNGKATAQQVDEAIKQLVIQHTVSTKAPWYKIGSTQEVQRYGYQIPAGAVGIAPGSDKQMHYHDAAGRDLGVAQ